MKKHPYFATRLKKEGVTFYLEENTLPFMIRKAGLSERLTFGDVSNHYYQWMVTYEDNYIYIDTSHYMTDGSGAQYFIADFMEYYIEYIEGEIREHKVDTADIDDECSLPSDIAYDPLAVPFYVPKAKEISPFKQNTFKTTNSTQCILVSISVSAK